MNDKPPLSDNDRREINAALFKLNQATATITLLDKLGHDTNELVLRATYLQKQLQTLKDELFPGQP